MKVQNALLIAFTTLATALAQDPPSRVARLSLVQGAVSFQPAGVDDWSEASLNYPLTTGDHVYADQGAKSELRLGPNSIRLSGNTNFAFLNLDDQTVQISLTEGSIIVRVRAVGDQDVWEVDTPNGAISLLRAGEYRIDTDPARNATMVTVRGGEAEVTANGQSFPVRPRQTAYFSGDGRQESIQSANPPDEFDQFALERDRREDSVPPPQYVSQQMVGYEDLDQYGSWDPGDSEDGPVWRPRVQSGWSPYHDGRWAWRDPWGWTWIDDAPWGFAPFHYGRWAYARGGWGWYPGPVVARPVYAPALVAFVGGGGLGITVGFGGGGGVGWFPLGPREVYRPAYRVTPRYERALNGRIYNDNRTVTNIYVNRNAPGAFTVISRQDFVGSRSVQRVAYQGPRDQFRSEQVTGFSPGVAPQRESLFGRNPGGQVVRPRDSVFNREVIARTPPPAGAIPFASRQGALRENQGRPLDQQQIEAIRGRGEFRRPAVRSAISPGQGFGRGSGAAPNSAVDPQRRDTGFGRGPQTPQQPGQPAIAPQPNTFPADRHPQQDRTEPRQENRGFGRNTQQPQTDPAPAATQQQNGVTDPAQRNRGFGRTPQPESTPAVTPQPNAAPETQPRNRGFERTQQPVTAPEPNVPEQNRAPRRQDRMDSRPSPDVPRSEAPVRRDQQPARVETPASQPAPRTEAPAQNREFGRGAQRQEARPESQRAPQAERQAERANRRDASKEERQKEKPKEEKPKN